ncbi:MAG: response regulator [Candidatus Marinimicrobia bacterium]|nr:response regulator [Candidatus Neomarinimicrobiota bacterium]
MQPEIIISDISLPNTDGSEIVRQIRGSHPNVHIILSSGLDDHVYQEKMCDFQVELMIKKPFNIQQLRSMLLQARQSQTDSD